MNSLLQCLSNFTLPSQYFIGEKFREHLNRSSDTRGEIAVEFAEVIRMLWSGQYKSIAPTDFKYCIGNLGNPICDCFLSTQMPLPDQKRLLLIFKPKCEEDY